jgi:hypothetical protein
LKIKQSDGTGYTPYNSGDFGVNDKWDAGTKTLTLENNGSTDRYLVIMDNNDGGETVTIYVKNDFIIETTSGEWSAITAKNVNLIIKGTDKAKSKLTAKSSLKDAIFISGGNLTIEDIILTADSETGQYGCYSDEHPVTEDAPNGYAGIWVSGTTTINKAQVEATGNNTYDIGDGGSYGPDAVFGIYSAGAMEIKGTSYVVAKADNKSKNEGKATGLFSGEKITIDGSSSTKSTSNVTATANEVKATTTGSEVMAEGIGKEGNGVVAATEVEIGSGATLNATGHGSGYAVKATDKIQNEGTVNVKADDEAHQDSPKITGNGETNRSLNSDATDAPASSSGGCDTGFGGIAALFTLGMAAIIREKRV